MIEQEEIKKLEDDFDEMLKWKDEMFERFDKKLERIAKILSLIEWKIEHFGEAWPDDV